MKFSDGYWLVREGFTVQHPAQAHQISADATSLSVLAPTGVISSRADTLNRSAATVTLSSPAPDIIRVRIEHHVGHRDVGPNFVLPGATDPEVAIEITDATATLTSGELSARVHRGQAWRLEFTAAGSVLTSSGPKNHRPCHRSGRATVRFPAAVARRR